MNKLLPFLFCFSAYALVPNDPQFKQQWAMSPSDNRADIQITHAWTGGQGGFNQFGEQLVVAIMDEGFDLKHEDLQGQYWVNPGEVPGNGIDDDQNGYIDDVTGWNVRTHSGVLDLGRGIGTKIAGIIGAKGNNGKGVAGVNWNIKMVPVMGYRAYRPENAQISAAFEYVIKLKRDFLKSGGRKGANIVALNLNLMWGYAKCDADMFPIWNDYINKLGSLGVLTVVGTTNQKTDVDNYPLVPSSCDSDFLITVTYSSYMFDLNGGGGYGAKRVDLAAPGHYVLSTANDDRYRRGYGSHYAAAYVTGTLALMHSRASTGFLSVYSKNPAKGALILKKILLTRTLPTASYANKTVSGGRLNVIGAVKAISRY